MRLMRGFGTLLAALALASVALPVAGAAAAPGAPAAAPAAAASPRYGNPNGHVPIPPAGRAVSTKHPNHVIGTGTPASCTSAAVVRAVAKGGIIVFNCGPSPVTITMRATAKVVNTSRYVVLDGGGKITLNGAGEREILYQNACDPKQKLTTTDCFDQQWPHLIVQNLKFENGNNPVKQPGSGDFYGGGAIFALGGQLKVVNSDFADNQCHKSGPDLGGAAVRALGQWRNRPVYITRDTFKGGRCSNGSALSSIGVSWQVYDSVMTNNKAIGFGANPNPKGTGGGGSGGAIYTDGDTYSVLVAGTIIENNLAREGGGAIFFVSDDNTGTLTIKDSTLRKNPSGVFWTRPYPGIYYHSSGTPKIVHSTIK